MDEIGERMSEIQCPLLNLHGDADKLTTLEGSQLLQDKAGSKDKTLKVHKVTKFFISGLCMHQIGFLWYLLMFKKPKSVESLSVD